MTYFDYIHRKSNPDAIIKHDARYHKDGYKNGERCNYRFVPDNQKTATQNYADFASYWHSKAGNFRRGLEHIPYIEHPKGVVKLLRKWGYSDFRTPITMAIAYCHDLIEEAHTPRKDIDGIDARIGKAVLGGVEMLTYTENPLSINDTDKKKDKQDYINRIAKDAPLNVLAVKMADRLCNTMDFVRAKNPYAREYLNKGDVLFERLDEFPNKDIIKKTLDLVRDRVGRIPIVTKENRISNEPKKDKNGKTIYPKVRKFKDF